MPPPAGSPFDRYHNTTNDEPDCMCSHVLDEHDQNLACTVGDCFCVYYEADEPDDDGEGGS